MSVRSWSPIFYVIVYSLEKDSCDAKPIRFATRPLQVRKMIQATITLCDLSAAILFKLAHSKRFQSRTMNTKESARQIAPSETSLKATSHSTIFDIPMRLAREDQRRRRRFTR